MKTALPIVAIPLGLDAAGRWRPGRRYHYLDVAYAEAVREAGALPVHVSREAPAEEIAARSDGLLVPGGDDLRPDRPYPPEVRFTPVPPEQLAFDAALLTAALARDLPVLGICYGMQLLVRHHGGRLLYDIAHDRPASRPHQLDAADARHELEIEPGSRLAAALGRERCRVNSRHHQGVAEPGAGLRVSGRAEDGTIEAVEADSGFVLGVQWHPESLEAEHRAGLFGAFVGACRSAGGGP